ncbi:hypothetical protein LTR94_027839 [Friedmanniomyces endolithicus]|nr:hypothetical protein LTR94_027839 [Friedmanniomyces endolithicus]
MRAHGRNEDLDRRLAKTASRHRTGYKPAVRTAAFKPGSRLEREWKGERYQVDVIDGGYVWNGRTFTSLSPIARQITGSRWNGPRFFGLQGLEQDYNSLHAQRDACAAYVMSQAGEGWTLLPEVYDDGGYSGGNLDRPALQRLMADIEAKKIDVVVVYKVDRLTRSLADFSKIVDVLDRTGSSFVSVTQAFNTTTSMGRLTLNVLLSFAQFEREVTGERIRDKIAASKKKGLWMGGRPVFGYDPDGRTLTINPEEAEQVQWMFARYLEIKSVNQLIPELKARGVVSKRWIN